MIVSIGGIVLGGFILYLIYLQLIAPVLKYIQTGLSIGFDKVAFVYKPFTGQMELFKWSSRKYGHSYGFYLERTKKNPMLKVIILKLNSGTSTCVVDPEMIKKMTNDYYKLLPKSFYMIFANEVDKGLFFSNGETWKNSRAILSNLFHFQKIRSRQSMMEKVIQEKISDLNNKNPNLFKLGCSIGGQIVVKSLFGQQFFKVRFASRNPYQEIHELFAVLVVETLSMAHIGRLLLFGRVTSHSKFLFSSQKRVLQRLLTFKSICKQFLIGQKQRFDKGEATSPFLEVYFKLDDVSYYQEIIHQLFLFMLAGQDTTGSLIEMCLAMLATYPEYQDLILEDTRTDIYASKELSNFISQVNRRRSSIVTMAARLVSETFSINGLAFPKGSQALMGIGGAMLNPKFWNDPDVFNPRRFNAPIQNPSAFIPFSAGPRNCIGQHMALMEVKLTLVRVLQQYKLVKTGTSLDTKADTIINCLLDSHYVRFQQK